MIFYIYIYLCIYAWDHCITEFGTKFFRKNMTDPYEIINQGSGQGTDLFEKSLKYGSFCLLSTDFFKLWMELKLKFLNSLKLHENILLENEVLLEYIYMDPRTNLIFCEMEFKKSSLPGFQIESSKMKW